MSYTNPQQIVDTQSAQHLANLQQTITGTFANVAANYAAQKKQEQAEIKKRQEENAKIIKANQDEEDNILYNYEKYKIDNPELNLPDVLPGVISEYDNIKNALDLGTISDPKEQARLKNKLLKIKTLPDQLKSSITALSEMMLTYKESRSNAGKQGGLDTKLTDPNFLEALNVFFNNTSGKRDVSIEFDENGNLNTDFIIEKTGKDVKGTGEIVKIPHRFFRDYLADKTNSPIVVIPDLTKNQEKIDEKILVKDMNGKSIVPSGLLKTKTQKIGDFVEELKVVDPDRIKSQYGKDLKSDIESMDNVSFMSYYNNILNPSDPITPTEAKDSSIMQQKRQEGADLYVDNYIQRYRKYEEVISKTRIPTPEKPKGLTADEKKSMSNVEDAKIIANDIKRDPRLKFDYESLSNLATEYNLSVFESGTEEQIKDNSFSEIVIKGSGGVQATILKTDTPEDIARKIIRTAVPKLGEKNYKEVFEEIGKLRAGEGVNLVPTGIENVFE
jgi:hypothetical protein